MKFKLEDRIYDFDGTLTVKEAIFLQEKTGLGVNEIDLALAKGNPLAIASWMYTLKRRAGEAVRWQDMLDVNIRTYEVIPDELPDEEAEPATDERPDPTQSTGTTPEDATSAT